MTAQTEPRISGCKLALFWVILVFIVVMFIPVLVLTYYAIAKVTFTAYSCGSFARADNEIGWSLKVNAASCIGGRAPFSSEPPWFEATVFTDANGLRAVKQGAQTRQGGVMFVGDSWTFGYGVTFEQSFPGQFASLTGMPVAVAASPAYSSAQAVLLAERHLPAAKPRLLVYLDRGMWERAACSGSQRPVAILKPCYWQPFGAVEAELVLPPPGRVERFARFGVSSGGMVGAGEVTWRYFLIARPVALAYSLLTRAGLLSGFQNDFRAVGVDAAVMQRAALRDVLRLRENSGVPMLLLDPDNMWRDMLASMPEVDRQQIYLVDRTGWNNAVTKPSAALASAEREVPGDGHFGPGTNRLIAELIAAQLRSYGFLP